MTRALIGLALILAFSVPSKAATFPWKSEFTELSSTELATIHESIHQDHSATLTAYPVEDLIWKEQDLEIRIQSGTIYIEPASEGVTAGAFFEGSAVISFTPSEKAAQAALKMRLGRTRLDEIPVTTAYLFSLRPDSPIANLAVGETRTTKQPTNVETYKSDKSAMRQLGLRLTSLLLNREGPASKATFVLFPMEEIRSSRSKEARLLYAFDPTLETAIGLSVFGHDEMVAVKPYKFRFYEIVSYGLTRSEPIGQARRFQIEISLGTGAKTAEEKATLEIQPAPGIRALRLDFTISMTVSAISGAGGQSLPFLQWRELRNNPNFDHSVLVALGDPSDGKPISMAIESSGLLFEPWFGAFVLLDEDDWFPNLGSRGSALHELRLTIPKSLTGIGVGEKISEKSQGPKKTVVFRSTQPAKGTTFYYGDYTMTEGKADNVTVELYQDRRDIGEQKNAKFTLTEITNAMKVFSRMFVPLDIDTLRVASTLRSHGRGFEGLLLLGARGTEVSSQSWADLFRAHEVAHQWWGNYVRPKRWPQDRWLSEAFAEFSAMEYYKIRFEDHRKALEVMRQEWLQPLTEGSLKRETLTGEKERLEGATAYPISAGTNNVYTKGPLVLNMLRYIFTLEKTDEEFFVMLRDFIQTYKYKWASTDDLRVIAEKHLGSKLNWFFDQWIDDGGLPVLKWHYEVVPEGEKYLLKVDGKQEQKKYRLVVPIYMHFPGDRMAIRPWFIEGETGTFSILLPLKPDKVSLNDNLESLVILKNVEADFRGH